MTVMGQLTEQLLNWLTDTVVWLKPQAGMRPYGPAGWGSSNGNTGLYLRIALMATHSVRTFTDADKKEDAAKKSACPCRG